MIGVGRQAVQVNVRQFLEMPDVRIAAVCDVDSWRLENARVQVEAGGHTGVRAFRVFALAVPGRRERSGTRSINRAGYASNHAEHDCSDEAK